jgi:colanic acid/amylovoran biosynthesis glycosyltransferase
MNVEAGLRLAYLTTRYPAISHSFVQREVMALRELGAEIETFSIHRPIAADLFTDEDRAEAAGTFSIRSAPWWKIAAAHVRVLVRHPRAYLTTLSAAVGRAPDGARLLSPVFHFGEAVVMWRECERRRIRHIHAHFTSPSADVAGLAALLGEKISPAALTWSFTAHGTDILSDSPRRLAEKVRRAPLVICVSDLGRAQLMRMVGEEHWGKVQVIRCGLDAGWQAAAAGCRRRSSAERAGEALHILTVGRLEREKGHSILLEAVAELRARGLAVDLEVVGGGSAGERLIAQAESLGIGADVAFAGKVGQDRIHEHYASADLFCLPSLGEGVPVVLMEAMAMGLPVVATRVGGVPELVEDRSSGRLVSPGSSAALAEAIAELADQAETRERMGIAGRERVLEGYSIERAANRLFGEFSQLALRRQLETTTVGASRHGVDRSASADLHR